MKGVKERKERFAALLLKWNKQKNQRQMPWKGERNPYKIWLSEIILQQTRVEQGLDYYNNFIKIFPNIHSLAKAKDEKVFKMWEGLGYYTRCKNLLSTARYISKEKGGRFPDTYDEIKALKGVGDYTASAIASFAFNLPYAVVDGNVFRVLGRLFGIKEPIDSREGKVKFSRLANELLNKKYPGIYNQSLMDFGATICKPQAPLCTICPFQKSCFAFQKNKIDQLPVKEKKINIRHRWFYYLVIRYQGKIAIHRRTGKDIWQHLYEFFLIETANEQKQESILKWAEKKNLLKNGSYQLVSISPLYKQKLSHQLITGQFLEIRLKKIHTTNKDLLWVSAKQLGNYPFPVFINQYLEYGLPG